MVNDREEASGAKDRRRCAGCSTPLAADNTGNLCGKCHREVRDQLRTPPTLGDNFWSTDEFRAAFESQHIGKVLRVYRNHPRHLHLFGKALNQELLGRWLGLTQAQVSKLENGKAEQHLETLQGYAKTLHIPQELLWFDLPGESRIASRAPEPHDLSHPFDAPLSRLPENLVSRKQFIASALSIGLGVLAETKGAGSSVGPSGILLPTGNAHRELAALPEGHWSKPIYDAVMDPSEATRQAMRSFRIDSNALHILRKHVDNTMSESLSSDYLALTTSIPKLIGSIEAIALQASTDDYPPTNKLLSDIYATAAWTLIKADCTSAAWVSAQRSVQAAERADDILRIAAATRCLSEVHMRGGNYEEAVRMALHASVYLEPLGAQQPAALSLRGAALLSAAAASARRGDRREAFASLNAATFCAAELREDRSDFATIFGPTNAAIHQVAIPLELGDATTAMNHIANVRFDHKSEVFAERRSRFLIDVARANIQLDEHGAAIDALREAEAISPDELRHHRLTRELVPRLMDRESRNSGLRELAARCDLLLR